MEISREFALQLIQVLKSQEALIKEIQTDVRTTNYTVNALNLEVKEIRKEINSKMSAKMRLAKNTVNKSVLLLNKNRKTSKRKIQQKEFKKQKFIKIEKSETTVSNVQGESSAISAASDRDGGGPIISEDYKQTLENLQRYFEQFSKNSKEKLSNLPSNKPPIPPPPYSVEILPDTKTNLKYSPQEPKNFSEHTGSNSKIVTVSSSTTKVNSYTENKNKLTFSSQKTDLSENSSTGKFFLLSTGKGVNVGTSKPQNVWQSTNSGFMQKTKTASSIFSKLKSPENRNFLTKMKPDKKFHLDSSKLSSNQNSELSYRCPQCGKSYKNAKYFENHLMMHIGKGDIKLDLLKLKR